MYPVVENDATHSVRSMPVWLKKFMKVGIWNMNTNTASTMMTTLSTMRSLTTVPNDLENDVPSYLVRTPHRVTSPERGMMRLLAYDRKMACTQFIVRGYSPSGASVCFHRRPRNTCAVTPNTNESDMIHQLVSRARVVLTRPKSKSRYIQYKMAPPSNIGSTILSVSDRTDFVLHIAVG